MILHIQIGCEISKNFLTFGQIPSKSDLAMPLVGL